MFIYFVKVIISKKDKSDILMPTIISLLLLFVASYLGFYSIQDRLVQIYGIVLLIFCGCICEEIEYSYDVEIKGKITISKCCKVLLFVMLTIIGIKGCKHFAADRVYKPGSEVSESIAYLNNNFDADDKIYVYRLSIPIFTYETDYKMSYKDLVELPEIDYNAADSLGGLPYESKGIIWGQRLFLYDYKIPYSYEGHTRMKAVMEDVDLIKNNDSVFLFASHGESGIPELIDELEKFGTVTTVIDYYDTHLYHYVKGE